MAAVALVALVFVLSLALATAQERTVEAMRERVPAAKRWGGRILIVEGVWFIALAAFAGFFARVFPA